MAVLFYLRIVFANHLTSYKTIKMGIIYKITNPSNKVYVGKTYNLRKRINCHKCVAKKGSNIYLHNSIRKYGWDAHILEVIEDVEDSILDEREIYWIKELKTYYRDSDFGMNMTIGGEGQRNTWMDDLERRKKASIYFTENSPFRGKKHTEESKKSIAEKASKRNKDRGITIPKWGAEKGRLAVIKSCVLYNNNGDFVSTFDSVTDCANYLGVSTSSVIGSLRRFCWIGGKYKVFYKNDNFLLKIDVGKITIQGVKRPLILIKSDGGFTEFNSALDASLELNIPKTTIARAALQMFGRPIRTGHRFIYKDLLDKLIIP